MIGWIKTASAVTYRTATCKDLCRDVACYVSAGSVCESDSEDRVGRDVASNVSTDNEFQTLNLHS